LLKLSLDDARVLLDLDGLDDVAVVFDRLRLYRCRFIVLTDGARGAWFSNRLADGYSEPVHLPAFAIESVEPTGAGDAFMASTIARLIDRDWQPLTVDDVQYASAAGALTTTRSGAIDSLPTRPEIEAFLQSQSGR
jgi:sugar/nucleoside kinase (ribokinase family)